jgi:hypothetical protein
MNMGMATGGRKETNVVPGNVRLLKTQFSTPYNAAPMAEYTISRVPNFHILLFSIVTLSSLEKD